MDPNVQGLKSETCNFLCHKRCSKYYQDVRFSILVNHIYADLWEETDDAIIFLEAVPQDAGVKVHQKARELPESF